MILVSTPLLQVFPPPESTKGLSERRVGADAMVYMRCKRSSTWLLRLRSWMWRSARDLSSLLTISFTLATSTLSRSMRSDKVCWSWSSALARLSAQSCACLISLDASALLASTADFLPMLCTEASCKYASKRARSCLHVISCKEAVCASSSACLEHRIRPLLCCTEKERDCTAFRRLNTSEADKAKQNY